MADTVAWKELHTHGHAPPHRRRGTGLVVLGNHLITFGGLGVDDDDEDVYYNSVHALNLSTNKWEHWETTGEAPSPRCEVSMCVLGGKVFLFGGAFFDEEADDDFFYNDIYTLDPETKQWERLEVSGTIPNERSEATMCAVDDDTLLLFAGAYDADGSRDLFFRDVHLFCVSDGHWTRLKTKGHKPPSLRGHGMVNLGDGRVVVVGGRHQDRKVEQSYHMHIYVLDLDSHEWEKIDIAGKPPRSRYDHTVVPIGNEKVLLFGGLVLDEDLDGGPFNDVYLLDMAAERWTEIRPLPDKHLEDAGKEGLPGKRLQHAMAARESQVYVTGGYSNRGRRDVYYDAVWTLDCSSLVPDS